MSYISLNKLLEPIPGDDICGVDLSFSNVFDEIREARRQDDSTLAQGEWESDLKTAQWPRVKELCEQILGGQSKDLQIVAWYTEAMTRLKGFEGLALGLQIMDGLLNDFWEFCYPTYDPDDLEERAGKIEWLNNQMPLVIREVPLTDRGSGAYSWIKWEESRRIDNLGLKDQTARELAIASGKLSGEHFDKAVQASGRAYYEKLHACIQEALIAATTLARRVDERFGLDAPSLKELVQAVRGCDELVSKLLERLGGFPPGIDHSAIAQTAKPKVRVGEAGIALDGVGSVSVGLIVNRNDAVRALREVAAFFRHNEPHSPVALLVERAASWAEMPLEKWLASVIKDQTTLSQLRELLDVKEMSA